MRDHYSRVDVRVRVRVCAWREKWERENTFLSTVAKCANFDE